MKIIVFTHHDPAAMAARLERHVKKTGRPLPPTPPRRYEDMGTSEAARRAVLIPSRDTQAVEQLLRLADMPSPAAIQQARHAHGRA